MEPDLTPLPVLPYYNLVFQSAPPLLYGVSVRPLSPLEVTEVCELLLATAVRHACPYWMLDGLRQQSPQPQTLHNWMREEYFPRVRRELKQMPFIAFLVPLFIWEALPKVGYDNPLDEQVQGVRMGWFTDPKQGLAWLNRHRADMGTSARSL
ncbi:hypothetical protein LRS06_14075 [Hymenobacter sp. J193]|uniref:hypothetical protein n=1 Tax=Hymenobacter sp. J193 TaxID=2898429 RepID=UPI0021519879|nr:hypothetical protein [Hymenobacter sp. J193]MCR5888872.1 hypothetical protein [Hymenobacter sp. J193]